MTVCIHVVYVCFVYSMTVYSCCVCVFVYSITVCIHAVYVCFVYSMAVCIYAVYVCLCTA